MKNSNRLLQLMLVLVLTLSVFLAAPSPVQAGFNGQQLSISACKANRVIIKGTNQWGAPARYVLNKSAANCGYISIPGWWWKGTVNVHAYYYVSPEYPYLNGKTSYVYVPTSQSGDYVYAYIPTPTTREWMIWRAKTWIFDKVSYSQTSYRDGYRKDCSGYVSFVWQLPTPGATTRTLGSYSYQIAYDSMAPGDILNNSSSHVMIFMGWVDKSQGKFTVYEENGAYGTWAGTLTLNKTTGTIKNGAYTYPGLYKAFRKNGL